MNDDETLLSKLVERQLDIYKGIRFYPSIINRNIYSSTPEELSRLESYYKELKEEYTHIDFKKSSSQCLGCEKLLTCPKKCEK